MSAHDTSSQWVALVLRFDGCRLGCLYRCIEMSKRVGWLDPRKINENVNDVSIIVLMINSNSEYHNDLEIICSKSY